MNKSIIDKLGLIVIKNNRVLCARSKGKTLFYIPGGKRETGETDFEALSREIKEELNVTLNQDGLKFLGKFSAQADGKNLDIIVQVTCYTGTYEGELVNNSEIEELAWISFEEINKCSLVTQNIINWLVKQDLLRCITS